MTTDKKLLTAEDLFQLPDDGYRYELLDGELAKKPLRGAIYGAVLAMISSVISTHVEACGLGTVLAGSPGVILRRNPDRVRAPDVCFIAHHRLPAEGLPRGYLEVVPDLIVEVISPSDRATEVQEKIEEWLRAGAQLVWAVYPDTRSVVAYQSQAAIRVYTEADILDGEPVLPGFTCPVARLFA